MNHFNTENVTHLDKTTLLQTASCFQQTPVNLAQAQSVLSQLLCWISFNTLEPTEATDLFFKVIQLFQVKESNLRSLLYLVLKELMACGIKERIMVTQSLLHDLQANTTSALHRSQALRALGKVTECLDKYNLERILKTAIVDPHPWVRSAVMIVSYRHVDNIRPWSLWLQEAIHHPPSAPFAWFQTLPEEGMTQYHGLGLLSRIRWTDPMALNKLLSFYAQKENLHPLTRCHWIRCARELMVHQPSQMLWIYKALVLYLHHSDLSVRLEAARAVCYMPDVTTQELMPAISVLQAGLDSSQPVLRFGCLRLLEPLAFRKPKVVALCHTEIERCLSEPNLAILALMTLLKSSDDAMFEHRLTQLGSWLQTASDGETDRVLETLVALGHKYPKRQYSILTLLVSLLHQRQTSVLKQNLLDRMIQMPLSDDTREIVLSSVSQEPLSAQVLGFLAEHLPQSLMPARYIQPILRSLDSDQPQLQVAAVQALDRLTQAALETNVQADLRARLAQALQDPALARRVASAQPPTGLSVPSPCFKQTAVQSLTEPETEYLVSSVTYVCQDHVAFEFRLCNTLDTPLHHVRIQLGSGPEALAPWSSQTLPELKPNTPTSLWLVYQNKQPHTFPTASFDCQLIFFKDVQDCYQLENLKLTIQDYLKPHPVPLQAFCHPAHIYTFHRSPTLQTACTDLIHLLALQPLHDTALVRHPSQHTLLLSGLCLGQEPVQVQCELSLTADTIQASVRIQSPHPTLASHLFSFLSHAIE